MSCWSRPASRWPSWSSVDFVHLLVELLQQLEAFLRDGRRDVSPIPVATLTRDEIEILHAIEEARHIGNLADRAVARPRFGRVPRLPAPRKIRSTLYCVGVMSYGRRAWANVCSSSAAVRTMVRAGFFRDAAEGASLLELLMNPRRHVITIDVVTRIVKPAKIGTNGVHPVFPRVHRRARIDRQRHDPEDRRRARPARSGTGPLHRRVCVRPEPARGGRPRGHSGRSGVRWSSWFVKRANCRPIKPRSSSRWPPTSSVSLARPTTFS